MLKVLGVISVILSGALIGYLFSLRLIKRKKILLSYANLARRIGAEIKFSGANLNTVLARCTENETPLKVEGNAVIAVDKNCLSNVEQAQISSFFHLLGKSDAAGQYKLCEGYEHRFTEMYSAAKDDCTQKCRIYRTLGLFCGIAVAIFLM